MSLVQARGYAPCPKCGGVERTSGYGFAAGPLGSYRFCVRCDALLQFHRETDGLDDEQVRRAEAHDRAQRVKMWGEADEELGKM